MIHVQLPPYTLSLAEGRSVDVVELTARASALYDEVDVEQDAPGDWCLVSIGRVERPPILSVLLRYSPAGHGFSPGVCLATETDTLFIGAGVRILAYDLRIPRRVVTDTVDTGFWHWRLHGDVVMASAEQELAAWAGNGSKLWSTYAEPPWTYEVLGNRVLLKADAFHKEFDLYAGPS
jgi:hypothetical protein